MQKEEQMRRRNPKAHTAMVLARREKDLLSLQLDASLHKSTPLVSLNPINSTQQVRWDAPMIATGEMLRLPFTAPDATLGTTSMLDAPLLINHGVAVSPNLDEPKSGTLSSSIFGTREGTSVSAPKQTQSSLDVPQRLSETPRLTTHDLQNHIDTSITVVANNQVPQREEPLGKETSKLWGEGSLDGPQTHKVQVSKALRKATRKELQAIILKKRSENKYEDVANLPQVSYARELQDFIAQKAKSEEEYCHLASKLKHLLEEESTINPRILLKVLSDASRPPKLDAPRNNVEEFVGPSNGMVNGSQENKGGRKRSASVDDEHPTKKMKPAPPPEKMFVDLLRREAARSSPSGSAA